MASSDKKKKIAGFPLTAPTKTKLEIKYNRTSITATVSWDFTSASIDEKKNANRIEGVNVEIYCDTKKKKNKVKKKKVKDWKKVKPVKKNGKFKRYTVKGKKKNTKKVKSTVITGTPKVTKRYFTTGVRKIKNVKKKKLKIAWSVDGSSKSNANKPLYPVSKSNIVDAIVFRIQGYNSLSAKNEKNGWNDRVPTSVCNYEFSPPAKPEATGTWTAATNTATVKLTGKDEGKGKHWYQMNWDYTVTKYPPNTSTKPETIDSETKTNQVTTGKELARTYSFNTGIPFNTKYVLTLTGQAKGVGGDAAEVTATYEVGHPPEMEITEVSKNGDAVTIAFQDAKASINRKAEYFQLQRLKDFTPSSERVMLYGTDLEWLAAVLSEGGNDWDDVGDVFNKDTRAFIRNYTEDRPSASNPFARTYYRIKATNECTKANGYAIYSKPKVLSGFKKVPSARSETMEFDSIEPQSNGTSVYIRWHFKVTYTNTTIVDEDGNEINNPNPDPNSDGTEISWSSDEHAWKSNREPEKMLAPDKDESDNNWYIDGPYPDEAHADDPQYKDMYWASCYIRELSEGTPYFFQGRRYLEENGDMPRSYGKYTSYGVGAMASVTPTSKPSKVIVKAPETLPVGKDLDISWTYVTEENNAVQKKWVIYAADPTKITPTTETDPMTGDTIRRLPAKDDQGNDYTKLVLASGENAAGYMVLPYAGYDNEEDANDLAKNLQITGGLEDYIGEWGNSLWLEVGVATSGDYTISNTVQVTYESAPESYLNVPTSVTSSNFDISIGSSDREATAIVRISSTTSYTVPYPDGLVYQPGDTVIFSKKYQVTDLKWQEYNGSNGPEYFSNIKIPSKIGLSSNQTYELSLLLENERTHLTSALIDPDGDDDIQTARFSTNYPASSNPRALDPAKVFITSNREDLSATINIMADSRHPAGEVCYIYRHTPDGSELIAEDVSFGSVVVDKYAPYTLSRAAYTEMLYPNNREVAVPGGLLRQSELRYRIAVVNVNGDINWTDIGYNLEYGAIRFDWGTKDTKSDEYNHLDVPFNLEYSDVFTKGASFANHFGEKRPDGYWDDTVGRTSTITTKMVKYSTTRDKEALRSLANYNGPVFVRRPDGCAYTADVQVNNISMSYSEQTITVSFTITEINSVDQFEITKKKDKTDDSSYIASKTEEDSGYGTTVQSSGTWVKHTVGASSS